MTTRVLMVGLCLGLIVMGYATAGVAGSPLPPAPPTKLTAQQTDEGVHLTWEPGPVGAEGDGFRVYRSAGGPFTQIAETTQTEFLDPNGSLGNLPTDEPDLGMLYYVTALQGSEESAPSNVAGDYPYCWGLVHIPGPLGFPAWPALECYFPPPWSLPLESTCNDLYRSLDDLEDAPIETSGNPC